MTQSSDDERLARALRGFGPLGVVAALVIVLVGNAYFIPIAGLLVLAWVHLSRTPWREIGFVRPRHWIVTIVVGIVFGVAFKLFMKAIVMPLLGADPINQAYHYLAGNRAALPGAIWMMIVSAGFGEETVFRGFLFERLGKLFGSRTWAKAAIVVLTSAGFGIAHYASQGLPGVQQATIFGLVFGSIFAITGRIWMLMITHAAFDLTALALIYWNLETKVARFVFN
jgi:membrane protease YdiL (CAAX protease family)